MKQLFTILFLGLCLVTASKAQFSYLGGPEGYNITYMAALGDSLLAVNGNQVYLNAPTSGKNWAAFSNGLLGKDSLVRAFESFQGKVFIAQGNKIFNLKAGAAQWKEISTGIKAGRVGSLFLNLENRELLMRSYDADLLEYYWYHYNPIKQEWETIDPKALVGFTPRVAMLPNGNILSYTAGVASPPQYRSRFDASTREWKRIDTLSLALFNSVIAISDTELLAGGTSSGIMYRSTNGGKNWVEISPSPISFAGRSVSLYKAKKAIYAVASEYIGRSTDGGKTWKEINDFSFISSLSPFVALDSSSYVIALGIPFFHVNTEELDGAFSVELNPPFFCTGILQASDNLFFYGRGGIFAFEEQDGEASIVDYSNNIPRAALNTTLMQKAGTDLIAVADFGLYRYSPGQGWRLAMDSLELYIPYLNGRGLATRQDTVVIFDGISSYFSVNKGKSWKESEYTPFLFSFQGFANGKTHLLAGFDGELYRWVGKKLDWEELKRPGNNLSISNLQIKGDTLIARTSSGWFYTTNLGQQWKTMLAPASNLVNYYSTSAGVYGAETLRNNATSQFYEINAAGQHRLLITAPIGLRVAGVASRDSFIIAMIAPNRGYIQYSSNKGKSWKNLDTRRIGFVNNALIDGDLVYLMTSTGVWTMPLRNLTTGIFELRPLVQAPLQAWPNPSSGSFTIKDSNQNLKSALQVKVFNTLGQLVKEQKVQVWNNQFELDLQGQTPGQYWLWASDGEKVWSTKLLKQ